MVANLINNNGRAAVNQFIITGIDAVTKKPYTVFQSYKSLICQLSDGSMGYDKVVRIGSDWNYSTTTSKHLYNFLQQNGLECLASKKDIEYAQKTGHPKGHKEIAVIFDEIVM